MSLAEITPSMFYGVAWAGLLLVLALVILLVARFTKPAFWPALKRHADRYVALYSGALALIAMIGSLWLSDVAGITPCVLCWYQRIAMYPLVVIGAFGYWMNSKVRPIMLTLAGIGGAISIYHYALQRLTFLQELAPCQANASCSSMYLGYWGWYSIPLMALTIFVAIIVLNLVFTGKSVKHKKAR